MSSLTFLVTELQSLASETRRKHPEVREAAEKSLAILRASPEQATASLASDGPQSEDLLRPVFMGCATKNAKVVAISLGSLQRLIALKAVPQSHVPLIINTMSDAIAQGVDIQLKILQTLLSLMTNFPQVHGGLLADALLLCFKLHESKIAVVSSTAAATLRQLVMFVVDKMVGEDDIDPTTLSKTALPDGGIISLGPSASDAYHVFEDLCLLANADKPNFLRLEYLHKTFALELIESVLTNYHEPFRKREEFILLLRHHLCPLLLKALSERPVFALTLRCTRVVFLLLKQFSRELETESEVFLMLLIKIVTEDADVSIPGDAHGYSNRPHWMRVIAMEIMRGLCSDAELIRSIWDRYDAQESGSNVFTTLITSLKRLLTEKPAVLGVGAQMSGLGVNSEGSSSGSGYGLDGVAGMVATAASATMSMMGSSGGLSLQGSSMKLQCIDQLDKADSPPIPESYIYLLGVQCLVCLCDGLAAYTGPLYNTIVVLKPREAGDAPVRAPPALDFDTLPSDEPSTKQLRIVRDIIDSGWPALLAGLSFIIATNLSDELFVDVLASYQAMTNVSGMLGLTTPRDAFFTSLSKFAVPTRVVSSLHSSLSDGTMTPRSPSASFSENLGLTAPSQPPSLSERNLACLKVSMSCAMFLAGSLGESWFGVLETIQNADYVLTARVGQQQTTSPAKRNPFSPGGGVSASRSASIGSIAQQSQQGSGSVIRHPLLMDLDTEVMQGMIQRLFDSSKSLEDEAFKHFVDALCRLSGEMIGMQSETPGVLVESYSEELDMLAAEALSPRSVHTHRRRASGIHIPKTMSSTRAVDFGVSKLGHVAMLNIHRLIYRSPEIAWDTTTRHLLDTMHTPLAPQAIRIQAARVLDEILVIVPRNLTSTGELQAQVQRRVLDVLSEQTMPDYSTPVNISTTAVELRKMGLETLHQILQASGHTLVIGWETIFEMLGSVCKPPPPPTFGRSYSQQSVSQQSLVLDSPPTRLKPLPALGLGAPSEKSYTGLIKIAFQSLTLVCDMVSLLSPEHLRLCISTLGQFGRQVDTNIALTAAASLLWSVSDAIQSKRKIAEQEPEYSELWMFLLLEVLGLCTDSRPEVRDGAIQTLFRTMQLYGATLTLETWDECVWKVIFPLVENITAEARSRIGGTTMEESGLPEQTWDESKTLALQSLSSIFHDFLTNKIMLLPSFEKAWDVFVNHVEEAVLLDNRSISPPALRCLEKAIKASSKATGDDRTTVLAEVWRRSWTTIDHIGDGILKRSTPQTPLKSTSDSVPYNVFTQESLGAFVDVIQSTRTLSRSVEGIEWPLEQLRRLMIILRGVLTYPTSPDYRPDVDALPPLQALVMDTVANIDLSAEGAASLVMTDLADMAALPFMAAFDLPKPANSTAPPKRVTYIAVAKHTMPLLVEHFLKFKNEQIIYADGTLEAVLAAYSIPIKLKYDCPPPSKFGKDLPLWKTATTNFLRIVKECSSQLKSFGDDIPAERIEGIWRQVLDVFKGGILADCSAADTMSLEDQEKEENFDLALIAALEIDVVPHLGDSRIPDHIVAQLAKVLLQGSKLYELGDVYVPMVNGQQNGHAGVNMDVGLGTTLHGSLLPRERFSYWCFDLLFLICSDITKEQEPVRRRLASLSLPSLLNRCRTTMVGYVADESLRGNLPFPRAREDELLYTLRKLLRLRLWPGSLWAALSEDPSAYCVTQPIIDSSLTTPSQLISDAVKRSSLAHLFHFYPVLCEIASVPRRTPSTWVMARSNSPIRTDFSSTEKADDEVVELDARVLARQCLQELGREMGVV